MKKYLSEFLGTMILVLIGCGCAMLTGPTFDKTFAYIVTAIAFGGGLIIAALTVAKASGCHINPAVSLAMFLANKLSAKDFIGYVCAQVLGAVAGSFITSILLFWEDAPSSIYGFGTNSLDGVGGNPVIGVLIEAILTYAFILAIIKALKKKENAAIYIGCALTLIHIIAIGLTGTSVNPARSLGPAIVQALTSGGDSMDALKEVWVFIVGPIIGALVAGFSIRLDKEAKESKR